ncbi:ribosomal-processing cysteine protease Prp [Sedimentibacter sp. MB31-C6]|uniref:ribosomal-processing cysteine protease Prp n=1 Tax=Sedimentibacter sp. MB31-C6 TaxID=3109366 RepID=UPI002DDD87B1|nr:ribosomal-processing cysteine protease Prp [Sedimentibacter sp. MB36-C1]WSI03911.1 ribosomal-processing cysteine protease Prp [Sedimentibacter sp. MB36-C1]
MIVITMQETINSYNGFIVEGHSDYGETGSDIVCAAISILSYTVLNSMNLVAGISSEDILHEVDEETGFLKVKTLKSNDITDSLYRSFIVGIQLLLDNYEEYITLKFEEV